MKSCVYCAQDFPDERPYAHCINQTCIQTWMVERRSRMGVALLPKQGFEVVYRKDMDKLPSKATSKGYA